MFSTSLFDWFCSITEPKLGDRNGISFFCSYTFALMQLLWVRTIKTAENLVILKKWAQRDRSGSVFSSTNQHHLRSRDRISFKTKIKTAVSWNRCFLYLSTIHRYTKVCICAFNISWWSLITILCAILMELDNELFTCEMISHNQLCPNEIWNVIVCVVYICACVCVLGGGGSFWQSNPELFLLNIKK